MPVDRTTSMTIAYQCPCGGVVHVDPLQGGRCEVCGRTISPNFLSDSESAASADAELLCDLIDAENGDAGGELIGVRLGHFRIMAPLGRGGMGMVYRALDESLQRYVALKVITDRKDKADRKLVDRLLNEARSQARVNHPHVVHIYYVSHDEETPFLAMELVHGTTLADRLKEGPLPFPEIIRFAHQIVDALQQGAMYDIIHGDIKPGNILLSDDINVKLSDFGLSRRLSQSGTNPDRIAGTPNYISPEACRGEQTDVRSDMYALGVMLFEMTFGRLPYTFDGDGPRARMKAHCTQRVEFPTHWPDSVPELWRDVLARLLAKNPTDRYWTYDLLSEDLQRLTPVTRPQAGRLVRGLAWIVDLFLAFALQRFVLSLFEEGMVGDYLATRPTARLAAICSGLLIPVCVAYLQSRWKTTPGKELLQIGIVDGYGLTPKSSRLAFRTVLPMLPVWYFAVQKLCDVLGGSTIGYGLALIALGILGMDAACLLLRRDRRSLHDLLLDTQVVLDAPGGRTVSPAAPQRTT